MARLTNKVALDHCSVNVYTTTTFSCENGLCHSARNVNA
jgi:hypothetical protein